MRHHRDGITIALGIIAIRRAKSTTNDAHR
jgi:hypothetical protein